MTTEELKELLAPLLAEFKTELLFEVSTVADQKNQGTAASLNKQIKKIQEAIANQSSSKQEENPIPFEESNAENKSDRLTLKALQKQVEDLNTLLKEKEQAALNADKRAAISRLVAESPTVNKSLLQKVFTNEYSDRLVKEADTWFYSENSDDGDAVPLDLLLTNYLQTDEGKAFLPPSGVSGSGAKETKTQAPTTNQPVSLDAQWSAFTSSILS